MSKTQDKVFEYIDSMAEKLGVASEHVYGVLVKQQVATGIDAILSSAFLLVLIMVGLLVVIPKTLKHKDKLISESKLHYVDTDPQDAIVYSVAFISIFLLVVIFFLLPYGIKVVINPEYYAMRDILEIIKGTNG